MLIWGTRAVKRRVDEGRFHCPNCGDGADYDLVRAQRHGHVYWIPLFRMGDALEYVECRRCRGAFDPVVLTRQPMDRDAFSAAFGSAAMAAMAAVASADGPVSDAELQAMQASMTALSGVVLSHEDARRIASLDDGDAVRTAEGMVAHLEPMLTPIGKEAIVKSMLATAVANGSLSPEAGAAVTRIAGAMQVSPAHLQGIVADLRPRA